MSYFPTTNTTANQIYTATGSSGQFLTSSGSNGTTWVTNTTAGFPHETLRINQTNPPELEVKGRLVINGQDLEERLETIEKVLSIPKRDVILERKHPKLKKMYDNYIKELSKYRMWEQIKGDSE
jgi:hypothetical protein